MVIHEMMLSTSVITILGVLVIGALLYRARKDRVSIIVIILVIVQAKIVYCLL
jgi:hypothetical protein